MLTAGISVAVGRPLARPVAVTHTKARTRCGVIDSRRSISIRKSGAVSWMSAKNRRMAFAPFVEALDGGHGRLQLDVLRTTGEIVVDVSFIDRRNGSLDDLYVLLRHRPHSISQGQESA